MYVIRNQNNHYLGKHGEWLDGSHLPALFRTEHRDTALNQLFETNIRDFDLRGEIMECETNAQGYPVVEVLNPIAQPEPEPQAPEYEPADESTEGASSEA